MASRTTVRNILITFDISSIAGRDQLAGVLRFLREKPSWKPRLIAHPQDFTPEIVRNARQEMIDGIIINHAGSAETETALAESDIPLAIIGIRNPKLIARQKNSIHICNDNLETGRVAARHFLSLGNFRSFGYLPANPPTEEWSLRRQEGFSAELAKTKRSVSVFQRTASLGTEMAQQALAAWIRELPKPAAILGAWDYPGVQILEICRSEGIRVPQEVSVLGVDNDPLICEAAVPPLASVGCDYELEGYRSAATLARMLERRTSVEKPIVVTCLPTGVAERESAAPVAPASQLVKNALRYIERNAHKGISTKEVAKAMGVSQNLLSLRFREFSDISVLEALIQARLARVKTLLSSTKRKSFEIAKSCGFRNANYLKNLFRKRVGMSMRQYRSVTGSERSGGVKVVE